MQKEDWNFSITGAAKALAQLFPGTAVIASLYSEVEADQKEQKIKQLIEIKEKRVLDVIDTMRIELEAHASLLNSDYVNSSDFYEIFISSVKKIADERNETKRIAFKNILLNGMFSQHSYDDTEEYIRLLDQLSYKHVVLLKLFYSPKDFAKENNIGFPSGNTLQSVMRKLLPSWEQDVLFDNLFDLENMRLIDRLTGSLQVMMTSVTLDSLTGKLTSKGMTFVSNIIRL